MTTSYTWDAAAGQKIIDMALLAIIIVVVAVPEGLIELCLPPVAYVLTSFFFQTKVSLWLWRFPLPTQCDKWCKITAL